MIEIGYNLMDCVGSGTIHGLTRDRLFFFLGGCLSGVISMSIIDYFKKKKLAKLEANRK